MTTLIKRVENKVVSLAQQRKAKANPLSVRDTVHLKDDELVLIESNLKPRTVVNDKVYSASHDIAFRSIPSCVISMIKDNWGKIEKSIGGTSILRSCNVYRISHVPPELRDKETYSDAWHRDTTGVTNVQLFILLHETTKQHGAFRYIDSSNYNNVEKTYPELGNPKNRNVYRDIDEKYVSYFEGKRGDCLLISTFTNYHSATIPELNFRRDMVSIAFEPRRLTSWTNTLTQNDLETLLTR